MSLPNVQLLKPASSLELLKESREPEDFTITTIRHFISMEFGGWGVGAKITNDDSLNTVIVRLHSDQGRARIVPINSDLEINEWFDILIVEPNGVSGSGQIEIDIVPFKEAFKNRTNSGTFHK